jgi:toxin-antitoxin system PIN domain toxin
VIAVDTNVLIYANRAELPLHAVARTRLVELAEGAVPWGLPVVAAWKFVRIVTQPIFDPPTPIGQAVEFIDQLLASPTVRVLRPGSRHWKLLRAILDQGQVRGGLVTAAVIVALCREHGVDTVLSNDRDFDRFPDIRGGRLGS